MKKTFLEKLIESNRLGEFIQLRYDGKTQRQLAKLFGTSQSVISTTLNKIENENKKKEEDLPEPLPTPYEILYKNRRQVVALRKQGYLNVEIAKMMGVSDKDVFDFLDKRKKLTPQQIKEIKALYDKGKPVEYIANLYETSINTIKVLCKATLSSTTENTQVQDETITELDCISKFHQYLHQIETKAENVKNEETKIEGELQDLLHKIEIDDCSEEEGLEILKRIKVVRQHRRECKDFLLLVSPILELLKDDTIAKALKQLVNVCGRVNNKAHDLDNRIYFLRTKETAEN